MKKEYIMIRFAKAATKRKLHALAKADGRSLNAYIDRICEAHVTGRTS